MKESAEGRESSSQVRAASATGEYRNDEGDVHSVRCRGPRECERESGTGMNDRERG